MKSLIWKGMMMNSVPVPKTLSKYRLKISPNPALPERIQTMGQPSIGEVIKRFRTERGISQENLAKKAHIDRTTVARVECGKFKSLSVAKLGEVAAALGIDLKTLLLKTESSGEVLTYRSHSNHAEFILDYPAEGLRILSLLPKRKEFFFGKIEIKPQKTILTERLPHSEQIFLHGLDGKMLMTRQGQEFMLRPGECFSFSGISDYELYNPDQFKLMTALFLTYPSFLSE